MKGREVKGDAHLAPLQRSLACDPSLAWLSIGCLGIFCLLTPCVAGTRRIDQATQRPRTDPSAPYMVNGLALSSPTHRQASCGKRRTMQTTIRKALGCMKAAGRLTVDLQKGAATPLFGHPSLQMPALSAQSIWTVILARPQGKPRMRLSAATRGTFAMIGPEVHSDSSSGVRNPHIIRSASQRFLTGGTSIK